MTTWTYEKALAVAKNYKRLGLFNQENRGAYEYCRRNNLLSKLIIEAGILVQKGASFEECLEKTFELGSISRLSIEARRYYQQAYRKDWINKIQKILNLGAI